MATAASVDPAVSLRALAVEIAACRLCDAFGVEVRHRPALVPERPGDIVVVAVQPEAKTQHGAHPFASPTGRRLLEWLVAADIGATPEEVAARCHLTHLAKCHAAGGRRLTQAVRNCYAFLEHELKLLAPSLCITLGPEPLAALFDYHGPLESVVGRTWSEQSLGIDLFRILPEGCQVIPLPSPSPHSPWLRQPAHRACLQRALAALRTCGAVVAGSGDTKPSRSVA